MLKGSSIAKVLANVAELVSSQVVKRSGLKDTGGMAAADQQPWLGLTRLAFVCTHTHAYTYSRYTHKHVCIYLRTFKNLFVLIPKHHYFRLGSFLETHWVLLNSSVSLPTGYSLSISVL